jgi:hypothetical protein
MICIHCELPWDSLTVIYNLPGRVSGRSKLALDSYCYTCGQTRGCSCFWK